MQMQDFEEEVGVEAQESDYKLAHFVVSFDLNFPAIDKNMTLFRLV